MSEPAWTMEMFEALTTHSADIISLLDGQGRLLFNSPATLRINGFTPEELKDKDTFELIHPDDRAEVSRVFSEVLATPGAVHTVEYRYLTKDGRWLWMEAVASNQLDNPAVRGVVANSRDVSERKQAEAERKRLEQHLLGLQKLESLGVMAGGVAHDFNNLLALILGETSVLKLTLGTAATESVATIENAGLRARDLTQQLLTYAGRRVAPVEPTDLRRLVDELAPLLKLTARGEANLRVELGPDVPTVMCDQGQIRQVLLNLVLNAAEALSSTGLVTVRLTSREVDAKELAHGPLTASFAPGKAVVLEVVDTGAGMTPETMQRVFDPFFSTKQTGRGLGLAAVAGIVKSHEAGLRLESAPGRGTSFRIYFRPSSVAQPAPEPATPGRFKGRVLLVDDDAQVAKTTARVLRALGLESVVAEGGLLALERFASNPASFAFVICDVLMPGLNGPQTVERLRALRADVPVLFISGFTPDPGTLAQDGKTSFLGKPFDAAALSSALALLLPPQARAP